MKRKKLSLLLLLVVVGTLSFSDKAHATTTVTATYGDDDNPGPSSCVTEVYSINNSLKDCYYKPLLSEVPMLEERVLEKGFVNAYTGYFDLDHTEEYRPADSTNRALEVLGYDFLLGSESYSTGGGYRATKVSTSYVTLGVAVMDLYKALGQSIYSVNLYYKPTTIAYMNQSPAIKGLPGYVDGINTARGRTDAFITRTNVTMYKEKAVADLHISSTKLSGGSAISAGEFIVLAARMMNLYGEPVMSDTEMNAMLQVYGGKIPTYLNSAEKNAYLYLKARGVLNDDTINFSKAITMDQMLEILMCIADKDSRTDFKEIQLTMDIGSDLQSKGYFPKEVGVAADDEAIQVEESYNYSSASSYEYYIKLNSATRFRDTGGVDVTSIFVPSIPGDTKSDPLAGVEYKGIETDENGVSYYHLTMPILADNDAYMSKVKATTGSTGWFQINSTVDSDLPTYMWLEQGGGIYTAEAAPDTAGGLILKRTPFEEDQFKGSASYERKNTVTVTTDNVVATALNILKDGLATIFNPIVAYASSVDVFALTPDNSSSIIDMKIYNASNITSYATDISGMKVSTTGEVMTVTLPANKKAYFLASIVRDVTKSSNKMYSAIATIHGDVLIKYSDLAALGILYTADGSVPSPESYDSNILILNSKYGQIKLNNSTREIVVGSTLYKVSEENTVLFQYVVNSEGKGDLYVDYRVAYGWTNNIIDIIVTGNSSSYTVNIQTVTGSKIVADKMKDVEVKLPKSFRSGTTYEKMTIIPKGVVVDSKTPKAIMTTTYTLANWMIYEGVDSSGLEKDYCFVFYPEEAFSNPDSIDQLDEMEAIVGYSVTADGWVCKIYPLSRKLNDTVGKFTYTSEFGYVYNLPEWNEFTMDKYLAGTYILPISADVSSEKCVINANVNYYSNCRYGSRPLTTSHEAITIKDKKESVVDTSYSGKTQIKAAPAAVSSMYGGAKRQGYNVKTVQTDNSTSALYYYYGTTPVEVIKNIDGTYTASTYFAGMNPWSLKWAVKENQVFYLVNTWVIGNSSGVTNYAQRFIMFDDVLTENIEESSSGETEEDSSYEIIDGERKDEYTGDEDFSLQYLLDQIDQKTTWVIYFCVRIIPLVGIGCLTILVGLMFVSDNKIVQNLCHKFIDPVKILTFGQLTIEQLTFKKSLAGLILGYIGFAMLLDGNILRLLQYLGSWWAVLTELIRQI